MKGNGMKRFNGVVKGLGVPVLFFVVAMVIGIVPVAVTAEPLKVAAVFEPPIEEPWVNQIHVALVKARNELGIVNDYSESVKSAW
jgi:basic membrane protein A and related proteins